MSALGVIHEQAVEGPYLWLMVGQRDVSNDTTTLQTLLESHHQAKQWCWCTCSCSLVSNENSGNKFWERTFYTMKLWIQEHV